ncbi:MAG: NUMOD1 domain-containing DNA-binding protein [Sarcina sp.]
MKYYQDNDFFEQIDNEHKAYWLGYLYADGCVCDHGEKRNYLYIELHTQDKYISEEFAADLRTNRKVRISCRGYARFEVLCNKIGTDLIKLGCVPRKSNILKFPTEDIVPKELLPHFLRGYMDGDGCISTYLKKRGRNIFLVCEIKFIGTYSMLFGIKEFFESEKNVLQNKHSPVSYQISFTGRKYRDYVDLMYKESTIHLTRKKLKWDNFINEVERRAKEKELGKSTCKNEKANKSKSKKKVSKVKSKGKVSKVKSYEVKQVKEKVVKQTYQDEIDGIKLEIIKNKEVKKKIKIDRIKYKKLKEKHNEEYLAYINERKMKKPKVDNRVEQYNLNGELLKVWDSYNEAAEYYDINERSIRRCCNGEFKTYFKFIWKYYTKRFGNSNKEIYQYDLEGNLIKKWGSLKEAALYHSITPQSIERCAKGEVEICSNYKWKY